MAIKEILAKTILRTRKRIDSWFISNQGMNLYRGCIHNCVYCNGRNEKYQVNNIFGEDIEVKGRMSPKLAYGLKGLQGYFNFWHPII